MNSPTPQSAAVAPSKAGRKAAKNAYQAQPAFSPTEKESMILQEMPRVRYIAKRIHDRLPPSVSLDDLIHTGVLGLIEAVNHYDPSKHIDLGAYAKHRIRGAILDSLRELDWGPRLLRKKGRELDQARERVQARMGRHAEEAELAKESGMTLEELRELEAKLLQLDLAALHEQQMDDEKGESLDQQPSGKQLDPFALCFRGEVQELLRGAIGELPARDRQVLALYYYEELTMKEVGLVLGIGEARVSQLHSAALAKLRSLLRDAMPGGREG